MPSGFEEEWNIQRVRVFSALWCSHQKDSQRHDYLFSFNLNLDLFTLASFWGSYSWSKILGFSLLGGHISPVPGGLSIRGRWRQRVPVKYEIWIIQYYDMKLTWMDSAEHAEYSRCVFINNIEHIYVSTEAVWRARWIHWKWTFPHK